MPTMTTAAMLMAVCAATASAAGVPRVEVFHDKGTYRLRADMTVTAPLADVRRQLTDYANLAALNPAITVSSVRLAEPPFDARVATLVEACVPVFCRELRRVEDVREAPNRLVAEIVPELSDFRSGRAEWRLLPAGDGVRVQYRAELEPNFGVPPLVGTALVKQSILRELRALLANLERLAGGAEP